VSVANYDGHLSVTSLTTASSAPTESFKSGIFTYLGQRIDVSTPLSPNNINGLPLDPTIQKILALYPPPNGPVVDDVRAKLFFPSKSITTGDNLSARVNHSFARNETVAVHYTFHRLEDPNFDHTDFLPGLGG